MPKQEDLCSIIDSSNADVVILTKTWLSAKIHDNEIFDCQKRFNVYRCDQALRIGGDALIAVSRAISSFTIPIPSEFELRWVRLFVSNKNNILGISYGPPSSNATCISDLHDALTTF